LQFEKKSLYLIKGRKKIMHQQIKRKNYLWGVLGLIYSSTVLGEKDLDLKEEGFQPHAEVSTIEVPIERDIVDERELQVSGFQNAGSQDLLIKSDNLRDHLVSSGGTPFPQFEMLSMTVPVSNLEVKKEASDRQKEWLAKLIEGYLQRFPK